MSRNTQSRLGTPVSSNQFRDRDFQRFDSFPNENTLTVNVTHKQLHRLDPPFSKLVAIAPTRFEEGASNATNTPLGKGYDIKLETAKEIVFQHKAPDNAVVRDGKQWLNFKVNTQQMVNLALQYSPKEAFYALPATPQHPQIRDGLKRTIFVDVWSVFLNSLNQLEETSRIYVEYLPSEDDLPEVKGKYKTTKRAMGGYPYYDLNSTPHIYGDAVTWEPLENQLKNCELGLPIRGMEPRTYPFTETDRELPGFNNNYDIQFNPAYREHLKRRFAIHQYVTSDENRGSSFDWLFQSFQNRLETGRQHEYITVSPDLEFTAEDVQSTIRGGLKRISDSRHPLTSQLNRTQRCVLEKGDESSTVTI